MDGMELNPFCCWLVGDIFMKYFLIISCIFFLQLLEIVKREGLSLTAVLTTHHHW